MQPIYTVPIIPQNLRKDETIVQVVEALHYITDLTNNMLDRIQNRIQENHLRINQLNFKLDTASHKIKKLSGAKKATRVFSTSKYPVPNVINYESLFDGNVLDLKKYAFNAKASVIKDEALEPLQLYHVKINDTASLDTYNGLGDCPSDLEIVNDLLLHNSGKKPYTNYIISDTLMMTNSTGTEDIKDVSKIGAAPSSITERNSAPRKLTEKYFYTPDMGNVPIINVPLDLPDLPGIADDLRYVIENGPGIAPSAVTTPSLPELPIIRPEEMPATLPNLEKEIDKNMNETNCVTLTDVADKKEEYPIDSETILKPEIEVVESTKKPIDISDSRASLMEAIRKAGGIKKLKNSEPRQQKDGNVGNDFMADLHKKLSMRRKGISGSKSSEAIEAGSAMERISAMIPPPPIKKCSTDLTTEDEWED